METKSSKQQDFETKVNSLLEEIGEWTANDADYAICKSLTEMGYNGEPMVNQDGETYGWIQFYPEGLKMPWAGGSYDVWNQLKFQSA